MASTDNFKWLPIVNINSPAGNGNGLQVSATKWLGRTAAQCPGVVGVCLFPGLNVGAAVILYHGFNLDEYMDGDTDKSAHYVYEDGAWALSYDMHRYYGAFGVGNCDFSMYGYDTSYVNTLTQNSVSALATSTRGLIEAYQEPQATDFSVSVHITVVNENPYEPGGDSGGGGGGGEFELENSPIPLPDLPTLNILNTGFIHAYAPTLSELQVFQNWIWTDNPFENIWRSILGNPYDYIIGLRAIPVTPETETATQVTLGNVTTPSTITMRPVTSQYVRHNFGEVTFREYSKSFLDYSPYTRVSLYLPYIGFVKVDADILNEKAVSIQYHIDIVSGSCMAFVIAGEKVMYTFSGVMGADVPATNQSYNNMLTGVLGTVGGIASLAAGVITGGGIAVPMGIAGLTNSAAGMINAAKASVEHGNGVSGVPGVMGILYPYFIIMRPMQSIPENIQKFTGFPSNLLKPLNDVSGFTKIEYAHLENISATESEKAEIMALLKEGVIF